MDIKNLISTVKEIASEKAGLLGYELVDVEYQLGKKHDLLSVFIYKPEGISIDDCTNMTRALEEVLDKLDIFSKAYYLEVSSPGLDRPIMSRDDYRRNLGKEVETKLFAPMDGKKVLEGKLVDFNEDSIFLEILDNRVCIPIKSISMMKQVIRF